MERINKHLLLVILLLSATKLYSQEGKQLADEKFTSGNYSQAIELYKEHLSIKENAEDGSAWLNLGFSYFQIQNYKDALEAFLKAEEYKATGNIRSVVQTGISYLTMQNKEKAYEYLEKAVQAGLPPRILESNNKFDEIREEERFKSLLEKSKNIAFPCRNNPMNRQFDFWLGEWDVYANGQKVADSYIEYSLEGCLIIENYTAFSGYSGKSINFYDAGSKKWYQTWTDISGNVSRYEGELKNGKMYLFGENVDNTGSKSSVRMEFTPNNDGSVRQLYEGSTDGGKTWSVYFDGRYVKKK